ncbi:MAG: glycoside hydrolase family 3 C-terminal domain-containing protein [Tannerella sp.]|jgi:beta-glucosidase|nr:glycoside hydrolase family 3 C-terminal domain-containing protein [Tannerella sp.]
MKKNIILLSVLCCVAAITACKEKSAYEYPFRNPDLSIDERIEDVIGRLTVEEKVGQMMNRTPAIERLGIPEYDWWNEALHGVARAGRATVFPQSIAMAATFDEDALLKTFTMVSDEARAKYHNYQKEKEYDRYKGLTFWTPNINIFRDPRWGRGMETYGEDPFLTSRLGLAVVRGLQGDDPKYFKSHACAKHYAVHSGPEWNRHEFDVTVSPRDLYQTYLPAFETLVREGNVQEVMCAYNRYEGMPCCGSDKLLVNILRNDWGYENIILSDCGAIDDFWKKDANTPRHETHPDRESASVAAVRAGTDLECGGSYGVLLEAVRNGSIKEEELDVSLRRLFRGRFELGMFDPDERVPYASIPYSVVESSEHVAQALEMAHKSMVLLKNGALAGGKTALPLSKSIKKIVVTGPNAADSTMLWANYNGFPTHTETILEGIRNKAPDAEVVYEPGCNHTDNIMFNSLGGYVTSGGQNGMSAEFFNNTGFEGEPVHRGIVSDIHYTTGGNTQFAPNVNLTDFTARFTGEFESPVSGDVTFNLSGNDGFRLFIGSDTVMQSWTNEYGRKMNYTLKAEQGKKYSLKIEYIQKIGGADLNFEMGYYKPVDLSETVAKVQDADVIIFVGGLSPRLEGEEMPILIDGFKKGDRTKIELPAIQLDMLKALKTTGKPVIFVVCAGSALALAQEHETADAILNAWYGGQTAGTAVADILFGDYNPSGKLPVTFYRSTSQLPDFEDYEMKGRTYRYMTEAPLYPFGYGLSYTTFEFDGATLSASEIEADQTVTLTVPVKNTGAADGDEVVQVYVKNPNDPDGPVKALKGFSRIHVKAGDTENAVITLEPKAFYSFNDAKQILEIRPGKYYILYGNSSDGKDLRQLELTIRE